MRSKVTRKAYKGIGAVAVAACGLVLAFASVSASSPEPAVVGFCWLDLQGATLYRSEIFRASSDDHDEWLSQWKRHLRDMGLNEDRYPSECRRWRGGADAYDVASDERDKIPSYITRIVNVSWAPEGTIAGSVSSAAESVAEVPEVNTGGTRKESASPDTGLPPWEVEYQRKLDEYERLTKEREDAIRRHAEKEEANRRELQASRERAARALQSFDQKQQNWLAQMEENRRRQEEYARAMQAYNTPSKVCTTPARTIQVSETGFSAATEPATRQSLMSRASTACGGAGAYGGDPSAYPGSLTGIVCHDGRCTATINCPARPAPCDSPAIRR